VAAASRVQGSACAPAVSCLAWLVLASKKSMSHSSQSHPATATRKRAQELAWCAITRLSRLRRNATSSRTCRHKKEQRSTQ